MVTEGVFPDQATRIIADLTIEQVLTGKQLFDKPLETPYFWKNYFIKWIVDGIEECRKMDDVHKSAKLEVIPN